MSLKKKSATDTTSCAEERQLEWRWLNVSIVFCFQNIFKKRTRLRQSTILLIFSVRFNGVLHLQFARPSTMCHRTEVSMRSVEICQSVERKFEDIQSTDYQLNLSVPKSQMTQPLHVAPCPFQSKHSFPVRFHLCNIFCSHFNWMFGFRISNFGF